MNVLERDFADSEMLAQALAQAVATDLRAGIDLRGAALLALSGGSTPRRFLQVLAMQALDWSRVTVTLADDRWVAAGDARSNERLLRETLLLGTAAQARFVPLHVAAADPETALATIAANIARLDLPFDAVVLGMGLDGHCASLFPGGDRLLEALRPDGAARVLPMRAPEAAEPRMTLTLSALVSTRALYLHIEGTAKKAVLDHSLDGDPQFAEAPIRAVLHHSPVKAEVFWCP
jgi:6-phosphogluconolactonase